MSDRTRNTIVGMTIIIALAICMIGIFLLGKGPHLGGNKQYPLMVITPNANGLSPGAKVMLAATSGVGDVESTDLETDPQTKAVEARLRVRINSDQTLPDTTTASIIKPATVGTTTLDLSVNAGSDKYIPKDGTGMIRINSVDTSPFSGLIPQKTIDDLNAALAGLTAQLTYTSPEDIDKFPDRQSAAPATKMRRPPSSASRARSRAPSRFSRACRPLWAIRNSRRISVMRSQTLMMPRRSSRW